MISKYLYIDCDEVLLDTARTLADQTGMTVQSSLLQVAQFLKQRQR